MNTKAKLFPLSGAQKLVYYQLKFSVNKAVTNINATLNLECDIDTAIIQQAMFLALCRNKSVSVRMCKRGKTMKQYFASEIPAMIEYVDYTEKNIEEMNTDIKKWCCTPFENIFFDVPLYRAKFLRKPNGKYAFFFCVSHLAFDAYALLYMANDALYIYDCLKNEKPIKQFISDPIECITDEQAYLKSDKMSADRKYWENEVFGTEPYYTNCSPDKNLRTKGKRFGKVSVVLLSKAKEQNLTIPSELVSAVNEFCTEYSINPHNVYTVVLRQYLSKINGDTDDLTLTSTNARRATLKQKRSGGYESSICHTKNALFKRPYRT